jgi:hypothetical protein
MTLEEAFPATHFNFMLAAGKQVRGLGMLYLGRNTESQ